MDKQLKEYYKQIEKALDCPKDMRESFLRETKKMAEDFLAEKPDATFDEVKNFIGEPRELAITFEKSADMELIEAYRKRKLFIKRALIALFVLIFIAAVAVTIYVANYRMNVVITREDTIIIYEDGESEIISEETYPLPTP
ncbi:MAG: hypothetical protein ACOX04_06635 [Candidatus Scatomorpha sp.]|jgi:hypothetical protein